MCEVSEKFISSALFLRNSLEDMVHAYEGLNQKGGRHETQETGRLTQKEKKEIPRTMRKRYHRMTTVQRVSRRE